MATGNLIPAYVIVVEIKRNTATYWVERDMSTCPLIIEHTYSIQ